MKPKSHDSKANMTKYSYSSTNNKSNKTSDSLAHLPAHPWVHGPWCSCKWHSKKKQSRIGSEHKHTILSLTLCLYTYVHIIYVCMYIYIYYACITYKIVYRLTKFIRHRPFNSEWNCFISCSRVPIWIGATLRQCTVPWAGPLALRRGTIMGFCTSRQLNFVVQVFEHNPPKRYMVL